VKVYSVYPWILQFLSYPFSLMLEPYSERLKACLLAKDK